MDYKIEKPLFSVIIPTYNHARFINKCLDSLLAQTYSNWEAIVVNNYSTDNTIELVNEYKDPRISLINYKNNGIIAASRNEGISISKGEWICFLDSDDWWESDKLQACYERSGNNIDLMYHRMKIIWKSSAIFQRKSIKSWQVKPPVIIDLLVNSNPIPNSSVVVRKLLLDQIGGINEQPDMVGCEDYNALLRIASITDKFLYIPVSLGYYIIHKGGVSVKDNEIPTRAASNSFLHLLNKQQSLKHESIIRFEKGMYILRKGDNNAARKNFLFSASHGNGYFKLKSILMFFISFFT